MTGIAFEAGALERRYAFLDACPEDLVADVIAIPVGTLEDRVAGARAWYDALLSGVVPPIGTWPGGPHDTSARSALESMGLARFCKDERALVDAVMRDLLVAFGRSHAALSAELSERLRELEALERTRLNAAESRHEGRKTRRRSPELDDATLQRLRQAAARELDRRILPPDEPLLARWAERTRAWSEVADVFGDLGEMLGRGWDLSRGVLRHTGWKDLLKLRELVERLPELREIVRALGRFHEVSQGPSVAETLMVAVRRLEEERRETRTPNVPTETRGIERSGDIARMLPAEAAMLGHPKLRLLWHARRAERALLSYRFEGVETTTTWVERDTVVETQRQRPRPERGPILTIIDTSGSMHGLPERVAKAIVLEALRTAHAEKRRCFLYAYSGPGQVLEHELDLSPEGIGRLLAFLGLSFGGGNDEAGVLAKVLNRLEDNDWKRADVLFVSDGEWPAPVALESALRRAREAGTRFHGVQIGNLGRTGLHAVCDPVHVFRDWAHTGGWR